MQKLALYPLVLALVVAGGACSSSVAPPPAVAPIAAAPVAMAPIAVAPTVPAVSPRPAPRTVPAAVLAARASLPVPPTEYAAVVESVPPAVEAQEEVRVIRTVRLPKGQMPWDTEGEPVSVAR